MVEPNPQVARNLFNALFTGAGQLSNSIGNVVRPWTNLAGTIYDKVVPAEVRNYMEKSPDPIPNQLAPQIGPAAYGDDALKAVIFGMHNPQKLRDLVWKLSEATPGIDRAKTYLKAKNPKLFARPDVTERPATVMERLHNLGSGTTAAFYPPEKRITYYGSSENAPTPKSIDSVAHEFTHARQFIDNKLKNLSPFKILQPDIPYPYQKDIDASKELLQKAGVIKSRGDEGAFDKFSHLAYVEHPYEVAARHFGGVAQNSYNLLKDKLFDIANPDLASFELTPKAVKQIIAKYSGGTRDWRKMDVQRINREVKASAKYGGDPYIALPYIDGVDLARMAEDFVNKGIGKLTGKPANDKYFKENYPEAFTPEGEMLLGRILSRSKSYEDKLLDSALSALRGQYNVAK